MAGRHVRGLHRHDMGTATFLAAIGDWLLASTNLGLPALCTCDGVKAIDA